MHWLKRTQRWIRESRPTAVRFSFYPTTKTLFVAHFVALLENKRQVQYQPWRRRQRRRRRRETNTIHWCVRNLRQHWRKDEKHAIGLRPRSSTRQRRWGCHHHLRLLRHHCIKLLLIMPHRSNRPRQRSNRLRQRPNNQWRQLSATLAPLFN